MIPQRSLFSYIKPGEEDLWFWVLTEDFDETSGISAVGRWSGDFGRSWSKPCSLDSGFFSKLVLVVLTEEQGGRRFEVPLGQGPERFRPGPPCLLFLCSLRNAQGKK